MNCKFCKSPDTIKYGYKAGTQYYKCNGCKRKFAGTPALEGMRFPTDILGKAISLFYKGLSLTEVSKHMVITDSILVNPATIWRWVIKFSELAYNVLTKKRVKTSGQWIIDETFLIIASERYWILDVIDYKSGFILASNITTARDIISASTILMEASRRVVGIPEQVISNGQMAYRDAIERVFGS